MKTFATLLRDLEDETNKDVIKLLLPSLALKINDVIIELKSCETFELAEYYIALLERVKNLLDTLFYKKEIEIPSNLWKFSRDFERIDDEDTQRYLFNQIKTGKYPLL